MEALNRSDNLKQLRSLFFKKAGLSTPCLTHSPTGEWVKVCQMGEGGHQGGPLTGITFMATINSILKHFDSIDNVVVRAIQDDILIFGDKTKILDSLDPLCQQLEEVGCQIAKGPKKTCCFSPSGNYGDCPEWLTIAPQGFVFVGGFLGTAEAETNHLEQLMVKLEREVPSIVNDFATKDGHVAYAVLRASQQFRFDYFCRSTLPDIFEPFAKRFNDVLHQLLFTFGDFESWSNQDGPTSLPHIGNDVIEDFRKAWMQLPCRLGGTGIQNKQLTSIAGFAGAIIDIVPTFIQRVNKRQEILPGLAEFLTPILGQGSFDSGSLQGNPLPPDPDQRFAKFIDSDLPMPQAFKRVWEQLQAHRTALLGSLDEPPDNVLVKDSPLLKDAVAAGAEPESSTTPPTAAFYDSEGTQDPLDNGLSQTQKNITHEEALLTKRCLEKLCANMSPKDPRRLAFTSIFDRGQAGRLSDKCTFSSALFSSYPDRRFPFSMVEFKERFQNHFGLTCSLMRPVVGRAVDNRILDAYGLNIYNIRVKSRAAQRRSLHDLIQKVLVKHLLMVGETVFETPAHYMTESLTLTDQQTESLRQLHQELRKIIPDIVVDLDLTNSPGIYITSAQQLESVLIFDIKTLNSGSASHFASSSSTHQREENELGTSGLTDSYRKRPVDKKADQVPHEYNRRIKQLDRDVFGTSEEDTGPLQGKLESTAHKVRGLAFGRYCEISTEVIRLLNHIAHRKAEALQRHYPGREPNFLIGVAKERIRREWALCCHKGWVKLKMGILQQVKLGQGGIQARMLANRQLAELEEFQDEVTLQALQNHLGV